MVRLRLQDLGAHHGRHLALSGVNTPSFQGGELVAVIGPNAAGKSTLFKRMAGLLKGPGQLHLDGSAKGPAGICYMPQDTTANAVLTVYESVLLALKQKASWAVNDSELALIDGVLASLGIANIGFRNLGELSGGQRQLVSIAQTLVRQPEVLLMDEPTSALDMHRQVQVLGFVRDLARQRGMLVFVALHDLNQALRFANHTLVIADGTVRCSGPSAEVITVQMLREVYQIDARVERCSRGMGHVIVDGVV